ncbi:UDP-N-acetylglucosamine--undecaprenyl-phosphate N-acetylglucosaminephosphotransferase [Thaumasiovibrio subtropicus]|uniref:UDP-N-acetylglucosamine--undecaprenyl-phosphate N-acetylglucosaminephosphotransferase n=1 Tax=Thaumasiovibrio subtropicus TaxID=1891207 RepID=UPI000B35423A|nr:UDP-N-acetylglucosamine--undecaprenyl-phosphate N-acetylglucosaminephosphotransferase [Thaumasiovibrio subtropicus]
MIFELTLVFALSFCSLFILRKIAKRIDLVDRPNERKHHQGVIPLIGGISIFLTVTFALVFLFPELARNTPLYLFCATVLVIVGAIDDKLDISFKVRLVIQAAMSIIMMYFGQMNLHNLGHLLSEDTLVMSTGMSYFFTIIAVIGAINAFNMVDGIDGLLGGLATVTFSALGVLFLIDGQVDLFHFCALIVVAAIPYIMLNLGIPLGRKYKVFMGDAGSIFIGFTVIWMLVNGTQGDGAPVRPVTALWVIAIPLMDMATIMVRRIRKGQSPFKPDREHLHHICQRLGLSSRMTLVTICAISASLAGFGVWGEVMQVSEKVMFFLFLSTFGIYFYTISHIWRITAMLRRTLGMPLTEEHLHAEQK